MKIRILIASIFLFLNVFLYAQKGASAEVYFAYSYQGYAAEELDYLPTSTVCLVSGNNYKRISIDADSSSITQVIFNGDSIFMAELQDLEGDKQALIYQKDDIEELTSIFKVKVKKTKKYKLIQGYLCYKYIVTITNKETKEKRIDEIYATTEIGGKNLNFLLYDGIDGFILSSKKMEGDKITIMKTKKVIKKSIAYDEFLISDDYSLITYKQQKRQEEIKK